MLPHVIFAVLHVIAFCAGGFGLLITIPLHLIYTAVAKPTKRSR